MVSVPVSDQSVPVMIEAWPLCLRVLVKALGLCSTSLGGVAYELVRPSEGGMASVSVSRDL